MSESQRATQQGGEAIIARLAAWAAAPDLVVPDEVAARARLAILDTLGTTIGAKLSPDFDVVGAFVDPSADGPQTLIGAAGSASISDNAFVNAYRAHLLDFDDSHGDMAGHPTAVILPAVLAVAETLPDARFDRVVEAYVVGVEVVSRLGRALNPSHYDVGWHPTATIGVFGAAAACARLLGLTEPQVAVSLSLATAFSSGIKSSFGTTAKPLQVGRAAASGVQAALLARAGAEGRVDAFEHAQGYARVFERQDPAELAAALDADTLGSAWSLIHPGIIVKQYPCCGSTHSAIEAAAALGPVDPATIDEVHIRLHPKRRGHVDRPRPVSELDAKFSVQYTVGRALVHGSVVLDDFVDGAHRAPEALALLERTIVSDLDAPDTTVADRYVAAVSVRLTDGRSMEHVKPVASGRAPGDMLAPERIIAKFRGCVRRFLTDQQTDALVEAVLHDADATARSVLQRTR